MTKKTDNCNDADNNFFLLMGVSMLDGVAKKKWNEANYDIYCI